MSKKIVDKLERANINLNSVFATLALPNIQAYALITNDHWSESKDFKINEK